MHPDLPTPDADALLHSDRLLERIRAEIHAAGGAIAFSRYMELCLYTPGLGYYSAGSRKLGPAGDFVTAPELGPLFATCVADAMAPALRALGAGAHWLEVGGGSGAFAEVALRRLAAVDALPARYAILEPSADLRQRQHARLARQLTPSLFDRVVWLDAPPDAEWQGVLFANEVIDALPTPRFVVHEGEVWEEGVALDPAGGLVLTEHPADALLQAGVRHVERYLGAPLAEGYRAELLVQLPYWVQAVMGRLQAGAMLFFDYGYPRREYYLPQRDSGTLRAFYRQRVHNDVFLWPGLQDLTASVDFTALAEAGTGAGFDLAGYCTQAGFLLGNGLLERLAEAEALAGEEALRMRLRHEAKRLTLPSDMGERFQAMAFARDVELGSAFLAGDLSWRL